MSEGEREVRRYTAKMILQEIDEPGLGLTFIWFGRPQCWAFAFRGWVDHTGVFALRDVSLEGWVQHGRKFCKRVKARGKRRRADA